MGKSDSSFSTRCQFNEKQVAAITSVIHFGPESAFPEVVPKDHFISKRCEVSEAILVQERPVGMMAGWKTIGLESVARVCL